MVQLKSFRYLEAERHQMSLTEAQSNEDQQNNQENENPQERSDKTSGVQYTRGSPSPRPSSSGSSCTLVGGGNLVSAASSTDESSQRVSSPEADLSSSNAEYQEAHLDMRDEDEDDDDDDEEKKSSSDLSAEEKQQVATNERTIDTNKSSSVQEEATDPAKTKLRLYQPKGAVLNATTATTVGNNTNTPAMTTTEPVQASSRPATPQVPRGAVSPLVSKSRFGHLSNTSIFNGDNMSQYSLGQLKSASHFEIRWQNIRLVSSKHSKWPRFLTDNPIYKFLYEPDDNGADGDYLKSSLNSTFYSPPIQRKIPPTISEEEHGLEMIVGSSSSNSSTSSSSSVSFKHIKDPVSKFKDNNVAIPVSAEESYSFNAFKGHQTANQPPTNQQHQRRCILNNISGSVASGQITAILGPSGVGKTTLLNSLTGRNTLEGTGRVRLIGGVTKRMSVVTVPQVDVLPGKLTAMEDLLFTSRLKNPQAKFDHRRNIDRLVKHLHMEKFLHTRIDKLSGGEERRLSIARELLSSPDILILDEPTSGLDANTCKKIITALRDIVEHSDYILDKPMSIIITIHQPQQEVYNLFHRVYVMAVGGRAIYGGPPDLLLPTLLERSSLARVTPVDQLNENPAIVAIEVASGEFGPAIIDELAANHESQMYEEFACSPDDLPASPSPMATPLSIRNISPTGAATPVARRALNNSVSTPRIDAFHRKRLNSTDSSLGRPTPSLLRKNFSAGSQLDKMSAVTSVSYASTYDADLPEPVSKLNVDKRLRRSVVMKGDLLSHTITLIQRCWLLSTRDMFLMSIRVLGFLLVACGTVQIFSHAIDPDQHQCPQFESEVEDVVSFMDATRGRLEGMLPMLRQANSNHLLFFHLLLCILMVTSALTGLVFPIQMRMFMREYKNGWYSPASFVISHTVAELPVDMIGPILTLVIVYPLCNQPASDYYWREIGYIIIFILSSIICKAQAQFVGAILMDSVEMSVFMSCVAVSFPTLLSGIPIRVSQMVVPLRWASYLAFLRYSFESLMLIRYGHGMCPCDPELVYGYPTNVTNVALPENLNNMARGFLEINGINYTTTPVIESVEGSSELLKPLETDENLFLRFIRLMTSANNLFVTNSADLGDCQTYRSLYLISMDVANDQLPRWLAIMLIMFVVSRFLIYFVVKTVIKLRH